ncbi:MAG: D-erythronate dehydrogenase [Pseudomonadota bacterium]
MKILVLGAAGMIGRKVVSRLLADGIAGQFPDTLVLHDIVAPQTPDANCEVICLSGDVADAAETTKLAALRPDVIFHLAAIVSGEAERDFEKGWEINARGGWYLLDALRKEHETSGGSYQPRFVFSSSIAVFGGPYPDRVPDDFLCAPQTSYGAQKAMVELLVSEYSRKGVIDGVSLRLPTITVRPGKPNQAASSFYSGIIREPLNGEEAILPVPDTVRHWFASPRSAAGFLLHAAAIDTASLNGRRSLNMPGVSCTVGQQIEALQSIAGEAVTKHIVYRPDEAIMNIVSGWPKAFDPATAIKLGFVAEKNFEEIIRVYLEDDFQK